MLEVLEEFSRYVDELKITDVERRGIYNKTRDIIFRYNRADLSTEQQTEILTFFTRRSQGEI